MVISMAVSISSLFSGLLISLTIKYLPHAHVRLYGTLIWLAATLFIKRRFSNSMHDFTQHERAKTNRAICRVLDSHCLRHYLHHRNCLRVCSQNVMHMPCSVGLKVSGALICLLSLPVYGYLFQQSDYPTHSFYSAIILIFLPVILTISMALFGGSMAGSAVLTILGIIV